MTLPAASWVNGQQTAANDGFLLDDKYVYIVDCDGQPIRGDDVTEAGKMAFHASLVPKADLTVSIIRMEVQSK